MTTTRGILLVEDNEDDVFLMRRALQGAGISNPLYLVDDGQKAIDYLAGTGDYADRSLHPFPALIFLDLKLPFKSGHEVLRMGPEPTRAGIPRHRRPYLLERAVGYLPLLRSGRQLLRRQAAYSRTTRGFGQSV